MHTAEQKQQQQRKRKTHPKARMCAWNPKRTSTLKFSMNIYIRMYIYTTLAYTLYTLILYSKKKKKKKTMKSSRCSFSASLVCCAFYSMFCYYFAIFFVVYLSLSICGISFHRMQILCSFS